MFRFSVLQSTEAPLIMEAIDSAESLLRGCLRLHEMGVLVFSPSRVFLRMVSPALASVGANLA